MTTSRNHRLGLAALAVAGVLDLLQLAALGTDDEAPVGVVLAVVGLGVVTIIGVAAAWRGSRTGLLVAVVARVIDLALGLPAFFLDAPAWVLTLITVIIVLTIAGIWLTAPGLRRPTAGVA
jgi:hypothetical protein